MNNNNDILIRQRKEFLFALKDDISNFEEKLRLMRIMNFKNRGIKNLKLFVNISRLIGPYVLVAGIASFGIKQLGCGLPFYTDESYKISKKQFTSKDYVSNKNSFYYDDENNVLYFYKDLDDNYIDNVMDDNILLNDGRKRNQFATFLFVTFNVVDDYGIVLFRKKFRKVKTIDKIHNIKDNYKCVDTSVIRKKLKIKKDNYKKLVRGK